MTKEKRIELEKEIKKVKQTLENTEVERITTKEVITLNLGKLESIIRLICLHESRLEYLRKEVQDAK